MIKNRIIGKRYDGGKSPLGDSIMLTVPEPGGSVLDQSSEFHLAAPGQWNKQIKMDYDAILNGKVGNELVSKWADARLAEWGYNIERINHMSQHERAKVCNKLVRAAKKHNANRESLLLDEMLKGPRDPLTPGGYVDKLDSLMDTRGGLPLSMMRDKGRKERTDLHMRLRLWSRALLRLERPQGSSLHHLLDYEGGLIDAVKNNHYRTLHDACQIILVENNWGAAVPEIEGEWRVPFEFICWEFRISGVRVLAFTSFDNFPCMWMVYGADGHWVMDDYRYELGCASLPKGQLYQRVDGIEFRRVAKMCYDTIRASCIMLDAQVAKHEHVAAPTKLVQRRVQEGRAPLRDHYVVRLLHMERRSFQRARSAGGSTGVARASQRGHWRKGTWVHYPDPESGQVKVIGRVDDVEVISSKTWRRWHFAGDPRNLIHKEYRL